MITLAQKANERKDNILAKLKGQLTIDQYRNVMYCLSLQQQVMHEALESKHEDYDDCSGDVCGIEDGWTLGNECYS